MTDFPQQLDSALRSIPLLPRRMLLDTPGVAATVPMLRGVWGAALHDLHPNAYDTVFAPQMEGRGEAPALYLLRPAPPDPAFAPAVDWMLIGSGVAFDGVLRRAWDVATGMGLGPQRRRFGIRKVVVLHPDGGMGQDEHWGQDPPPVGWTLAAAAWPMAEPETTPCRLIFPAPLRLRRHGRLIEQPTLVDLAVAATRRIRGYLPDPAQHEWQSVSREAMELARRTPAELWRGERLDLHRYSARQQAELDLHGVTGFLDLPEGPGQLWALLAAAIWLHLGKGTIMGLGQMLVERL